MTSLPRNNKYVSAQPPRRQPLQTLWKALRAFFAPRKPTHTPTRTYETTAPLVIHLETPKEVWHVRDRGAEARRLLHRYLKGQPTSRRPCVASGMSDPAWRRARQTLMRAGVIDRKAKLLYSRRDAQVRLDAYLDGVEQRAYQSGRYVAP